MSRQDWLAALDVGDKVYVMAYYTEACREHVVTRVTRTQVTLDNGVRYTRRHGEQVGAGNSDVFTSARAARLEQITPENTAAKARWETERRARRLRNDITDRLKDLDVDTLGAVMAVLDAANPGKQAVEAKR
jgi:hypothetical protein